MTFCPFQSVKAGKKNLLIMKLSFYRFVFVLFFPFCSGSSLVALLILSVMEMILSCLPATTKQQSATQLICSNSFIFSAPPSSTKRFVDSLRSFNLIKGRGKNPDCAYWQFPLTYVSPTACSFCPCIKACSS